MATGTPEEVAAVQTSYTGRYLADLVKPTVTRRRKAAGKRRAPVAA
jgi:hypothetical protein